MNHFMLPDSHDNSGNWANSDTGDATRYGTFAMEHLINEILKNGGRKETLEIKLVGGARIVKGLSDVGQRNIAFIRHYLAAEGYSIAGEDLGDIYPRKVMYHPGSGRLQVKRLRSLHNDTIIERENSYREEIDQHRQSGEIDLF